MFYKVFRYIFFVIVFHFWDFIPGNGILINPGLIESYSGLFHIYENLKIKNVKISKNHIISHQQFNHTETHACISDIISPYIKKNYFLDMKECSKYNVIGISSQIFCQGIKIFKQIYIFDIFCWYFSEFQNVRYFKYIKSSQSWFFLNMRNHINSIKFYIFLENVQMTLTDDQNFKHWLISHHWDFKCLLIIIITFVHNIYFVIKIVIITSLLLLLLLLILYFKFAHPNPIHRSRA